MRFPYLSIPFLLMLSACSDYDCANHQVHGQLFSILRQPAFFASSATFGFTFRSRISKAGEADTVRAAAERLRNTPGILENHREAIQQAESVIAKLPQGCITALSVPQVGEVGFKTLPDGRRITVPGGASAPSNPNQLPPGCPAPEWTEGLRLHKSIYRHQLLAYALDDLRAAEAKLEKLGKLSLNGALAKASFRIHDLTQLDFDRESKTYVCQSIVNAHMEADSVFPAQDGDALITFIVQPDLSNSGRPIVRLTTP